MLVPDVAVDRLLQLFELPRLRWSREQSLMNVFRGVTPGLANDDAVALLVPFEYRARPDAQLAPDLSRNRDLTLRGKL
jgi:TctA family transporter